MVPLSPSSRALGLPGESSHEAALQEHARADPAIASACTGRALSLSSMVTTVVVPGPFSMPVTLPTSIPATRTGEPSRSPFEVLNTACTR